MTDTKTDILKSDLEITLNDESFVGIYYHEGKFDIKFPLGYNLDYSQLKTEKEIELQRRKDVLILINSLRHYKTNFISHKEIKDKLENALYNFPLFAYINVYLYYKTHGYYIPKETVYKKSNSGKINWNRTIKQVKPIVSNNNIIYLETIRNKINYNENELIAKINRYCVYQSFLKIGCLFTSKMVKEEKLKESKKTCIKFLTEKIRNTFKSDEINLFTNMKHILEYESNDTNNQEYYYGTTSFHTIWEAMVNDYFGENKKIRETYNPKLRWYDKDGDKITGQSSTLRPDTIVFYPRNSTKPNKIFILDSKYYKGSINLEDGNLPLSESVPKQLVYANWAIKINKQNNNTDVEIYNAFVMPDNLSEETSDSNVRMKYYGFVKPEWLSDEDFLDKSKTYNRIQGIKIDTKDLMKNFTMHNNDDYNKLLRIIEKEVLDTTKYKVD